MRLESCTVETPIGAATVVVRDHKLVLLDFADNTERIHRLLERRFGSHTLEPATLEPFASVIQAYFRGELSLIHTLPVDISNGSAFQRQVWTALLEIPAGETWSYARLAKHVGSPDAVRAVGATNGLNPISLVLPCHRVIGANGALSGYAGGVERKRWLLEHEMRHAPPQAAFVFQTGRW
jgi:methylated-DNA-[protein]-cysteine S-methyltransferase